MELIKIYLFCMKYQNAIPSFFFFCEILSLTLDVSDSGEERVSTWYFVRQNEGMFLKVD